MLAGGFIGALRLEQGAQVAQAFELADGKGFAKRKRESARRGKLRGFGIGNFKALFVSLER